MCGVMWCGVVWCRVICVVCGMVWCLVWYGVVLWVLVSVFCVLNCFEPKNMKIFLLFSIYFTNFAVLFDPQFSVILSWFVVFLLFYLIIFLFLEISFFHTLFSYKYDLMSPIFLSSFLSFLSSFSIVLFYSFPPFFPPFSPFPLFIFSISVGTLITSSSIYMVKTSWAYLFTNDAKVASVVTSILPVLVVYVVRAYCLKLS